jgi:hypothetical protein
MVSFRFIRGGGTRAAWQLQHGRTLTFAQLRQKDDPPDAKLKLVMMSIRPVLVDLLELSHLVSQPLVEDDSGLTSHFLVECELGAGS